MAETIEGGIYKDATGDGYHDANGKPVGVGNARAAAATQPPVTVETVLEKPLETVETVEIKPAAPTVPRRSQR